MRISDWSSYVCSSDLDNLIGDLQRALGLTVVMVTHDLDSPYAICDRVSVLVDKRVKVGTIEQLMREPDPWLQEYSGGPRGRAAARSAERAARPSGADGAPQGRACSTPHGAPRQPHHRRLLLAAAGLCPARPRPV